jgi:entry exclusion lipoprotein TrbK
MTVKRQRPLIVLTLVAACVAACAPNETKKQLPPVNDENCKTENLQRMQDKEMRQELASLCIRRGTFKPSSKREW